MRFGSFLVAVALSVSTPVSSADDAGPFAFRVGGVTFALPRPTDYCMPVGNQIAVAQKVAAADVDATTNLTLFRCDAPLVQGANDYTLIKTPTSMLTVTANRAELLASLGKDFDNPALAAQVKAKDREAGQNLEKVIEKPVTVDSAVGPRGRDSTCAYMGGTASLSSGSTAYVQGVGTCITVVGGRVLTITRYGKKTAPADIVQLLREAKGIAESISVKS